jgi:hypothetical protein
MLQCAQVLCRFALTAVFALHQNIVEETVYSRAGGSGQFCVVKLRAHALDARALL